jgi:hypothetical protein
VRESLQKRILDGILSVFTVLCDPIGYAEYFSNLRCDKFVEGRAIFRVTSLRVSVV